MNMYGKHMERNYGNNFILSVCAIELGRGLSPSRDHGVVGVAVCAIVTVVIVQ